MLHDTRTRGRRDSSRIFSLRRSGILAVLVCMALGAACIASTPGTYVVSATFNGGSRATVVLGSQVEIAVTVHIVGSDGTNCWWCSTRYDLACPETGVHTE